MMGKSFGIHESHVAQFTQASHGHPCSVGCELYSRTLVIASSHPHAPGLVMSHNFADASASAPNRLSIRLPLVV